jgi:protoheme IX farnesyltransferase
MQQPRLQIAALQAGVLAAALYFWQLPHFLSLSWLYKRDYARGGYRMMSLLDATGRRTAACCLRNSLYLIPVGAVGALLGVCTPLFAFEAAVSSGALAMTSAAFLQVKPVPSLTQALPKQKP